MELLQFRKKFRELSGRFDLVNEDYSDNGADFFINEGRKFLDRMDETQKSWGTYLCKISAGDISATFSLCRAVKEVWAASESIGRWQIHKKRIQELVDRYLLSLPSNFNSGTPIYYAPCITRSLPEGVTINSFEQFLGYREITTSDKHETNALLLNVPASTDLTLIIHGLFYSKELVKDSDVNYWSQAHPMLLYMSAMRQIEIANRSTQGVNDWTNSIIVEMRQLGMDLVEEIISETDQMEG